MPYCFQLYRSTFGTVASSLISYINDFSKDQLLQRSEIIFKRLKAQSLQISDYCILFADMSLNVEYTMSMRCLETTDGKFDNVFFDHLFYDLLCQCHRKQVLVHQFVCMTQLTEPSFLRYLSFKFHEKTLHDDWIMMYFDCSYV